jgi:acylphosphatase
MRVLVSGRVQGVWFRQSTAREVGQSVAGWVRNLDDGRVEAVFEGAPEAVAEAVAYVGHGPERAYVEGVERFDEQPEGLTGFTVR